MNQPQPGTQEYRNQVENIVKGVSYLMPESPSESDLSRLFLMYVMDMSYHRAAICEAMKFVKRKVGIPAP